MIDFNIPPYLGSEDQYIRQALNAHKISGDGVFTKRVKNRLEENFQAKHVLLTTSCTHALEMSAFLSGIQPGDEVIMPSYTFSSTANAFVLFGAKIVFVDIRPDTMNIDETLIEAAITEKTKAIVPVHYAGVSAEMDTIVDIAKKHDLLVIEDAAQGVMSTYKEKYLGTMGDFGCYSFHESKNYSMGEGGAIMMQSKAAMERAEILREKGTDRSRFLRGQIDKYTWIDYGSSYLPSDINAAYLLGQLDNAEKINNCRREIWQYYDDGLRKLAQDGFIQQPSIPKECRHNGHIYFIKTKDLEQRTRFIEFLMSKGIQTVFHYLPLHSSPAGKRFGRFFGEDKYTTVESERLVRLPLYYGLTHAQQNYIIDSINFFYRH